MSRHGHRSHRGRGGGSHVLRRTATRWRRRCVCHGMRVVPRGYICVHDGCARRRWLMLPMSLRRRRGLIGHVLLLLMRWWRRGLLQDVLRLLRMLLGRCHVVDHVLLLLRRRRRLIVLVLMLVVVLLLLLLLRWL